MNKKTDRFRVSHSLLTLWDNNKIDQAVSTYFHIGGFDSPAMQQGRDLHKKWQDSILKDKKLTVGANTFKFDTPVVEFGDKGELNKPYNELWDIGGRFDALDGTTLYEFKSGVKDSLDYAGGYQIPFYFLLAELSNIKIETAYLIHYNQHTDKADFTIIHNSPWQIERVRNWIDSNAHEIFTYFKDNFLIGDTTSSYVPIDFRLAIC